MASINKGKRRITFKIAAPGANEVGIAGTFNGWDEHRHPLNKKAGGFWEKTIMLAPGRYEYKFIVDGVWRLDPANSNFCDNTFGTRNSVITVEGHPPAQ